MAYIIVKTDGTVLTSISDGTLNTSSTSLDLPGRNYASYGQVFDTNFVHLLENFSDSVIPNNPIRGQLWYNTNTQALYVCPTDGETNINNWFKILSESNGTTSFVNLTLTGNLFANNATIANDLISNTITADYLTVNVTSNLLGTSNVSNLITSNITADTTTGNLNGNWTVTGNLSPTGILSDNFYYANGDPINFELAAGNSTEVQFNLSNEYAASPSFTFNPVTSNLSVTGNINGTNFYGNAVGLSNISAANLTGTIATAVQSNITQLGTLASLDVTGNANIGNVTSTGNITAVRFIGQVVTAAQPNITDLGVLNSLNSAGVVNFTNASNVSLGPVGNVKITGGTNGHVLRTDGTGNLSWVNPQSIPALSSGSNTWLQYNNNGLFGSSANLTYNSDTGVLTVNGNINVQNANLGNTATSNFFIGNAYNLNGINGANVMGTVPLASTATTVTSSNQPFITSLGTLTSLTVAGDAALGNTATANFFNGNGSLLFSISGSNVTGTVANAQYAVTSGSSLSVDAANVVGTVANATYADTAGFVASAGTVTTGAQPNITSVGPLANLNVTGTSTFGGQLSVPITGIRFANLNYPSGTQNAYLSFNTWNVLGVQGTALNIGINSTRTTDYINLIAPGGARVNDKPIYNTDNLQIISGTGQAYGYTNIVGQFSDAANYFDVFPPSGYTMSNLIAFETSIAYIYFAGGVDGNDALRCVWTGLSDRVRVYVQNTEQRYYPSANYLGIWRK